MISFFARSSSRDRLSNEHLRAVLPRESSGEGTQVGHVRVAILGTGFSGLGMAIRLKQRGYDDFVVLEKAADIGGTWRDNTYPGCACDIQSHLYSFSFALNPRWSHTYARQREIQTYLRNCAKHYGILPHIRWNCALQEAEWHEGLPGQPGNAASASSSAQPGCKEDNQCWHITTTRGRLTADILILGNGPLSEPSLPSIPGLESFGGTLFHSAQWNHAHDLTGERVAVIGTGASAVQFVPHIQPIVKHLSLFLRTPPWILPRNDRLIEQWRRRLFSVLPVAQRYVRTRMYWQHELAVLGLVYGVERLKDAEKLASRHLEKQVSDADLRAKLTPQYSLGCKRILLSDDFYPALTQSNVEVVTDHIREVRAHSIVTADGTEHEVDTIICGTGFHVTDAQLPQFIAGRDGQTLAESWRDGDQAYLGTTVAGFPNLFLLIGPNTGLGHNSMVFMIESQLSYILDCLRVMDRRDAQTIEVRPEVQQTFIEEMQRRMQRTVWKSGCTSWYLDARGQNTTLWPGFTFEFRRRTRHFDAQHYTMQPRAR